MTDAPDLFAPPSLPDRSAFVRYAVEKFAAVQTWPEFWALVDLIRDKRRDLLAEGNAAADREVGLAAKAAHDRIPPITDKVAA